LIISKTGRTELNDNKLKMIDSPPEKKKLFHIAVCGKS
jgi:hypothetical protein